APCAAARPARDCTPAPIRRRRRPRAGRRAGLAHDRACSCGRRTRSVPARSRGARGGRERVLLAARLNGERAHVEGLRTVRFDSYEARVDDVAMRGEEAWVAGLELHELVAR